MRREYRIVKIGCTYRAQRREGWRTLWLWRWLRNGYGHIRECSAIKNLREAIVGYESRRRHTPTPMLVVEHTAPVERFDWATVAVDGKEDCECAKS